MNLLVLGNEAWAAFKFGKAEPEIFISWVADKFWEINERKRPYGDCKLMAEGFYEGVKLTSTGEMQFKARWKEYCEGAMNLT